MPHISVLPNEVLKAFEDMQDGVFVDCTLGFGGHTSLIANAHENAQIIGCDRDIDALNFSKERLAQFGSRVRFFNGTFSQGIKEFKDESIKGVLADIGVSSYQLDKQTRGFGFESDTLDMRMDQNSPLKASDVLNGYDEQSLEEIFREYGEISLSKEVAKKVVEFRRKKRFETPKELVDLIGNAKQRGRKVSIATLVFQALRIEVNDELGELSSLLASIQKIKPSNAIIAIITFHSLEDKIVKRTFKEWAKSCICPPDAYKCTCGNDNQLGKIITKKPITPSAKEVEQNVRSRSAKLRIFRFDA